MTIIARCTFSDCPTTEILARGLCKKHYGFEYRAGRIPKRDTTNWHRISDTYLESMSGVCSICGPVSISIKRGSPVCRNKRSEREAKRKRVRSRSTYYRQYRYGITDEDYGELLKSQDGKCAICGIEAKLNIDHCHDNGHVRGLLCNQCNTALGLFKDNINNLLTAIEYLKKN